MTSSEFKADGLLAHPLLFETLSVAGGMGEANQMPPLGPDG